VKILIPIAVIIGIILSPIGSSYKFINKSVISGGLNVDYRDDLISFIFSGDCAKILSGINIFVNNETQKINNINHSNNVNFDNDINSNDNITLDNKNSDNKKSDSESILKIQYSSENIDNYLSKVKTACGVGVSDIMAAKLSDYTFKTFSEFVSENYVVDSSTGVNESIINLNEFAQTNCTIKEGGKILIYHTHSQEGYLDSDGSEAQSVVGVGDYLATLLESKGYEVIHDRTKYDTFNGETNRKVAYSQGLEGVTSILNENPEIDVIIDLHRDSADERTVTINDKEMCQVMLFNGLSFDGENDIKYLPNPNRLANLAFSYQLKAVSDTYFEGFMHRIYLKNYRFNMHLAEKYILAEVGTQDNTVSQAMNSMEILAEVLDVVLSD
jgi:stage II sporulation protein P